MSSMRYFARAVADDSVRTPELHPLPEKTVALFGVGCLGATSALELARAGSGELRILDPDVVDPGTIGRWALGLSASGRPKVKVLADFIGKNYPSTQITSVVHKLGGVRNTDEKTPPDYEVVRQMVDGASLIYDATAEVGVHHYLSEVARENCVPYIAVTGTYGGWGGVVVRIVPEATSGCWMCYRFAIEDGSIIAPPSDPLGEIQPRGCGDTTFTGAGFDMNLIALAAVRMAVSTLCNGVEGAYPVIDYDILTLALRTEDGKMIAPRFLEHALLPHKECPYCNP